MIKEGSDLKTKVHKSGLSTRNKKRKDHKPIQEEPVEKVKKKRRKRSKKAKNKIEHISNRILSEDELKTARKNILEKFKDIIKPKPSTADDQEI